jgi:hypothetical protein
MSDLLSKLKLGTANHKLIDWPGTQTKVVLKILSMAETQEAMFATERHFKQSKIEVNLVTAKEYDTELTTQTLYRAIRDPQKLEEPIALTITDFRLCLNRDESDLLFKEYLAFEADCSPSMDNLSGEEFDRIVADVKKKPEETLGSVTNLAVLRRLVLFMVKHLKT